MSNPGRFSPGRGLERVSRRMSLEFKLPLLMSAVLAAVLVASLASTITTLRRTARAAAAERLSRAVHEIVTVGATNLVTSGVRYRDVGQDSAVQQALAAAAAQPRGVSAAAMARARAVLSTLSLPTDSGMPVELWTADGVRIAFSGKDVRAPARLENGRTELPGEIGSTLQGLSTAGDTLRFSALQADGSRVHYWLIMPVKRAGSIVGYIAHQRLLAVGPQTRRTLRQLSGDSVSIYYRNLDGRLWVGDAGQPTGPVVVNVDSATGTARLVSGERVLVHEERFMATPIVVGMYLPQRTLFNRFQRTTRTLELLGILLLAIGTTIAWLVGRSVARPLGALTRTAGALAAGDFAARAPEAGDLEVQRLADSFNHMAEQLGNSRAQLERQTAEAQAANRAKSEFLTTMSHELRTPLNAIGGYVDLIDMGLRGPVTPEQRRDLTRIKASQEHLLGLISGVLDLGRIEAGRVTYNLSTVPVDAFLRGLDALVAPQAAAKDVTLEQVQSGDDLAVVADREKLRQVLLNLLSNAIRHTPPGGSVTLSAESRGSRVAIRVEDTGPGIPPERREEIFEPFVQLDRSLSQTREGLGLGLAISRDLARGMAGDLVVEDRIGGGGRFVLLLPRGEIADSVSSVDTGEIPATRG